MKLKVRRKGFEDGETGAQVFFCLYNNCKPLTTNDIAKETKLTWKLVDYHLPKLLEQGLILKEENKYLINPILIDEDLWDIYYGIMKLLTSYISDRLILPVECNKEDGVMSILRILPSLFNIEIKE